MRKKSLCASLLFIFQSSPFQVINIDDSKENYKMLACNRKEREKSTGIKTTVSSFYLQTKSNR